MLGTVGAGDLISIRIRLRQQNRKRLAQLRRLNRHNPVRLELRPVVGMIGAHDMRRQRDPRNCGEMQRAERDQLVLAGPRIKRSGRLNLILHPGVHVFEKRSHCPAVVHRIGEILRTIPARLCARAMLRSGEIVDAGIGRQWSVRLAVWQRMDQARCASPVLVRSVGVEDLRRYARGSSLVKQSFIQPALGIFFRHVRERKDVSRIEEVHHRMAVARWLGETVIEAAPARPGDVRPHSVENSAILFIAVESVIDKGAQEASALRTAEADGSFHGVLHVAEQGRGPAVFEERN